MAINGAVVAVAASLMLGLPAGSRASEIAPETWLQRAGVATDCESLLVALLDEDSEHRWLAAHALGRNRDCNAFETLRAHLADPDAAARMGSMMGLGRLGNPAAISDLHMAARTGASEDERLVAVGALRTIGGHAAIEALLDIANDANQSRILRGNALGSLARVARDGRPGCAELRPALQAADAEVRAAAALVIAVTEPARAVAFLAGAVADADTGEPHRVFLMGELQRIAGVTFGYVGEYGMVDEDPEVRARAIEAMNAWWETSRSAYPAPEDCGNPPP
ncbi:MAG: HEAT repeat domain-containing protein [Steroidobacteraceae bacterium]|nr:HEAT repeat domain-containing protein [Steroidobacteraceae bacterium]